MEKKILAPSGLAKPAPSYSHGVRFKATEFLSIAGQVAVDRQGNFVGKGDMRAQVRQVMENLKTVLAEAGCSFKNIVKTTTFTINVEEYRKASDIYIEYFQGEPPPSTLVEIKRLAREELMVEIEALAIVA